MDLTHQSDDRSDSRGKREPAAPDISVVIVSYETRDLTDACVQSIKDLSGEVVVEVIVVDNCSSDNSAASLHERHPDITVIASPVNAGFAAGNLLGFQAARGRHVLLLNPDAELREGALRNALAILSDDRRIGVVGACVELPDGRPQSSIIRFPSFRNLLFNVFLPVRLQRASSWFGDPRYASHDPAVPCDVDAAGGAFMLVRRKVIDEVGGLDPRFFMYGEEVEWCRRIRRAGWRIVYRPDVRILHHGGASTSHRTVWKAREMMRGQLLYFAIAHGMWHARIAALLMLMRDLVRLPVRLVQSLVGSGAQHSRAMLARIVLGMQSLARPPRGQKLPANFLSAWDRRL